jgi:hypothetical protein
MFSGLPPKADLTDGPLFRPREQRREDRTPLFGQPLARRHLITLDQTADDHLLRRGVRDADHADHITLSGLAQHEGNPLLLLALAQPERLTERLLQVALDGSISSGERSGRLQALQQQLTRLRYDEEAAFCAALANGDEVSRLGASPEAVLMVEVEQE